MAKIISMQERRLLKSLPQEVDFSAAYILDLGKKAPGNDGLARYSTLNVWFGGNYRQRVSTR